MTGNDKKSGDWSQYQKLADDLEAKWTEYKKLTGKLQKGWHNVKKLTTLIGQKEPPNELVENIANSILEVQEELLRVRKREIEQGVTKGVILHPTRYSF